GHKQGRFFLRGARSVAGKLWHGSASFLCYQCTNITFAAKPVSRPCRYSAPDGRGALPSPYNEPRMHPTPGVRQETMASLFRLMQALLPAAEERGEAWQPPADVYRTRGGWLVKLDLAGVRPEDVQVSVSGPLLTVRGMRRDFTASEDCCCYQME